MDLIRCFVAVELPNTLLERLSSVQIELRASVEHHVKWVDSHGIHVTLKFLGSVPSDSLAGIEQALRDSVANRLPLRLGVAGLGAFPNLRSPRVIWVGLSGEVTRLASLQRSVDDALGPLGFGREVRPFTPHVTLGRMREPLSPTERQALSEAVARIGTLEEPEFLVKSITLMRSQLTPKGAIYSPISVITN